MRKRKSDKLDPIGIAVLIIIILPILAAQWLIENLGIWLIVIIILILCGAVVYQNISRRERRKYLLDKYRDLQIVEEIMNRYMWEGQTHEQLLDSLGHPASIDNHLLKTKVRQVWKYRPIGRNRYALRVTLDNNQVIGWEEKN